MISLQPEDAESLLVKNETGLIQTNNPKDEVEYFGLSPIKYGIERVNRFVDNTRRLTAKFINLSAVTIDFVGSVAIDSAENFTKFGQILNNSTSSDTSKSSTQEILPILKEEILENPPTNIGRILKFGGTVIRVATLPYRRLETLQSDRPGHVPQGVIKTEMPENRQTLVEFFGTGMLITAKNLHQIANRLVKQP